MLWNQEQAWISFFFFFLSFFTVIGSPTGNNYQPLVASANTAFAITVLVWHRRLCSLFSGLLCFHCILPLAPLMLLTTPIKTCNSSIALFYVYTVWNTAAGDRLHVHVFAWLFSLCRLDSEHYSASWQSQTQSQWPLEQRSVLEPRRLLVSVRWTPVTNPRPCPLDDTSPSGSACWTTQRSSLTSRWVVKAFSLRRISWWEY